MKLELARVVRQHDHAAIGLIALWSAQYAVRGAQGADASWGWSACNCHPDCGVFTLLVINRRTREWMPRERGRLIQGLRSIPGFVPYPGAANYFLVQLLPFLGFTAGGLRENLLPQGFLIRDCQSFQNLGPDFLQIAVRTRKENNLLLKTLRQIVQSTPAADEPPKFHMFQVGGGNLEPAAIGCKQDVGQHGQGGCAGGHGAADGDVGAWARRRRRTARHPPTDGSPASRRSHRRACPAVQLRRERTADA